MTIPSPRLPSKKYLLYLLFAFFFLRLVDCHGHSHDEDEHPPSFKYSREANEQPHSHQHEHIHAEHEHIHAKHSEKVIWAPQEPRGNSKFRQWPPRTTGSRLNFGLVLQAIGATLFVSFVPFLILFMVPVDGSADTANFLKILLSFASGGLLGDAFLHLIPHAIIAQQESAASSSANVQQLGGSKFKHGHSHDDGEHVHDLSVGLWVLVGIGTFLVVEKCLRIAKCDHGHSHVQTEAIRRKPEVKFIDPPSNRSDTSDDDGPDGAGDSPRKRMKSDFEDVKVSGYLNLAADVIHNFTDGIAIGASFLAGRGVGVITTVTIIFHEIPHEIGDFAILLQSGIPRRNAILLQLLTAGGAILGTMCSLLLEGLGDVATSSTLAFTAGGFIYIATVSVIPELLKDSTAYQSVQECVALVVGVIMMVMIAKFE